MSPSPPLESPLPPAVRTAVAEVGTASAGATAAMRSLRDAGHEVVYVGVLTADVADLDRRLAAACVQEDVDALVVFGEVPDELPNAVRSRLAEGEDGAVVLLGGPGVTEQVARCARQP